MQKGSLSLKEKKRYMKAWGRYARSILCRGDVPAEEVGQGINESRVGMGRRMKCVEKQNKEDGEGSIWKGLEDQAEMGLVLKVGAAGLELWVQQRWGGGKGRVRGGNLGGRQ